MSLTTYSELQTAVQNWLDNTNTLPTARVQEFIALCEADVNRRLRTRENLASTTGTTVAATATISLPARFGGVQSLTITNGGNESPLALMDETAAVEAYWAYGTGEPRHFVVEASTIRLYPTPDAAYTYTLKHWERVPALSNSATTNWLLTAHPDVYLFGTLVAAEGFNVNDPRLQVWKTQYELALEQVLQQSIADGMTGRAFMYVEGGTP